MKFVRENYKALLLVLFAILTEVIILPFKQVHSYYNGAVITYGYAMYYFVNQLGYASFLPSLFLYLNEKNINSRGIYLGLTVWNTLELLQEVNFLFKLDISFLEKTHSEYSDIMQVIFITTLIALIYHAYKKLRS